MNRLVSYNVRPSPGGIFDMLSIVREYTNNNNNRVIERTGFINTDN